MFWYHVHIPRTLKQRGGTTRAQDFDETVYNIMSSSHLSFFSRQEKLQMAFRKLDASMDDVLDLEEMMAFGRTFGTGVDVRKAKMTILWMDQDGDRKVCTMIFPTTGTCSRGALAVGVGCAKRMWSLFSSGTDSRCALR